MRRLCVLLTILSPHISCTVEHRCQMGYPSYKGVLREVFGHASIATTLEFPNHLSHLMAELSPGHPCANYSVLEKSTLLPWFSPFLPMHRVERIRSAMCGAGGTDSWNRVGLTSSRIRRPGYVRFCPECLREDKAANRELYWRRLHQLTGIEVCPKHLVFYENSDVHRLSVIKRHRFFVPDDGYCDAQSRSAKKGDEVLIRLARLGEQLLSGEWPCLGLERLRSGYLILLKDAGFIQRKREVATARLLDGIRRAYDGRLLKTLGCHEDSWLIRMTRKGDVGQPPIRHLLALDFLGANLKDLFFPVVPDEEVAVHQNIACVNHLCPQQGNLVCKFLAEEYSSILDGVIETYGCETCGQMQGRFASGQERTWVREYGRLWEERLVELWHDSRLSLNGICRELRCHNDSVKRAALKLSLPMKRPGRRSLSLRRFQHLLMSREDKIKRKVERWRSRWVGLRRQYPNLGVTGLCKKLPAVYAGLSRYDRQWLDANKPESRRWKNVHRADWEKRDQNSCRKVHEASKHLGHVSTAKLAKAVGLPVWRESRLAQLPNTKLALEATRIAHGISSSPGMQQLLRLLQSDDTRLHNSANCLFRIDQVKIPRMDFVLPTPA